MDVGCSTCLMQTPRCRVQNAPDSDAFWDGGFPFEVDIQGWRRLGTYIGAHAHSHRLKFRTHRDLRPTVDGRNPFRTTLKPWLKSLFVAICSGIIQGFLDDAGYRPSTA